MFQLTVAIYTQLAGFELSGWCIEFIKLLKAAKC